MSDMDTTKIGIGFRVPSTWFTALQATAQAEYSTVSAVLRRIVAEALKAKGHALDG